MEYSFYRQPSAGELASPKSSNESNQDAIIRKICICIIIVNTTKFYFSLSSI